MKTGIKMTARGTSYFLDGKKVSEQEYRERFPAPKAGIPKAKHHRAWPIKSNAGLVAPEDVPLAIKTDKERGAPPTEYTPGGRPIFTSQSHQTKWCRAHGYHNNDGAYNS
jgi:hypothetical protein